MAKLEVSKRGVAGGLGTLIFLAALLAAGYFYYQFQQVKKNPERLTQQEIQDLEKRVGKLMLLPTGEEPQLATVTDADKIKQEQQFFVNAENGDKVLIYKQAKKAILYRPNANMIIEVGPVTLDDGVTQSTPTPTLTARGTSIALLNGTPRTGATTSVEDQLKAAVAGITIASKDTAARRDYPKTLIVDLSGSKSQLAAELAQLLGGEVATFPDTETRPAADILVIVGGQ